MINPKGDDRLEDDNLPKNAETCIYRIAIVLFHLKLKL